MSRGRPPGTFVPLAIRFIGKFQVVSADADACWNWTGATNGKYGRIKADGGSRRLLGAHRVAWEFVNGPIPVGMIVRHKCDNCLCVRPSHLEVGTDADNGRDMAMRGRGCRSKIGLPAGVRKEGKRWAAQIWRGGQQHYLGTYDTIAEAALVAERERVRRYEVTGAAK